MALCGRKDRIDQRRARLLRLGQRGKHIAMLGFERDRRACHRHDAHRRADDILRRGLGDRIGFAWRQQEGRVAGKDDMLHWPRPARGKAGKIATGGARLDDRGKARMIVGDAERFEQAVQATGAALQRLAAQILDHHRHFVERQAALLNLPAEVETELEDRVEQGRVGGQPVQLVEALAQTFGHHHPLRGGGPAFALS